MGNIIVADTNVFIYDPNAVEILRQDGNKLVIPWAVLMELDRLKTRPDIGWDALEVTRKIEEIHISGDPSLEIWKMPSNKYFKDGLGRDIPDHNIVATALEAEKRLNGFSKLKLLSKDIMVRVIGRRFSLLTENYLNNSVEVPTHKELKRMNVSPDTIMEGRLPYDEDGEIQVLENEGVVCCLEKDGEFQESFAAIRRGQFLEIIPTDISAIGLKPFLLNGNGGNGNGASAKPKEKNWSQYVAFAQLLDPRIQLVFLQGGAGTGKTLMALACAVEQRARYLNIVITRPMVHLEDKDNMGFLPGEIEKKMAPWLRPIDRAFDFLKGIKSPKELEQEARKAKRSKKIKDKGKQADEMMQQITMLANRVLIEKLHADKKIIVEPLDYIRGMTYYRDMLIVDEAQNLTPHQIKTIITRAGMGTKIIINGDLGQIDRYKRLDKKSSGLAYAINRMGDQPMVGITYLKEPVRSPLVVLAEELL